MAQCPSTDATTNTPTWFKGTYTGPTKDKENDALPGILERLKEYGSGFSDRVQNLVLQLQVHPDLDGRFLGIRLSFSDYYRTRKEQQQQQQSSQSLLPRS